MAEKLKKEGKPKGKKFKVLLIALGAFVLLVLIGVLTGVIRTDTDGNYCNKYVIDNYTTEEGIKEEVFVKRFNECLESRGVTQEYWLRPSSFTPPNR